jgi:hypothetical protein
MKFMHSYYCKKIPFSFSETWLFNHERIPDRALRNANDYYIPQPRIELVKRMPLFAFPSAWNSDDIEKYILLGLPIFGQAFPNLRPGS